MVGLPGGGKAMRAAWGHAWEPDGRRAGSRHRGLIVFSHQQGQKGMAEGQPKEASHHATGAGEAASTFACSNKMAR